MPKTLVGKVKNERFAYFWLLIGGGLGNIILLLYSASLWPLFLPPAIASILIPLTVAGKLKRYKIPLAIDLLLTLGLLIIFVPSFGTVATELTASLPGALIIFGCILGICNW